MQVDFPLHIGASPPLPSAEARSETFNTYGVLSAFKTMSLDTMVPFSPITPLAIICASIRLGKLYAVRHKVIHPYAYTALTILQSDLCENNRAGKSFDVIRESLMFTPQTASQGRRYRGRVSHSWSGSMTLSYFNAPGLKF